MMDLRKYTVKDFAKEVGVDADLMMDLMKECQHLGYTTRPYFNVMLVVQRTNITSDKMEIVAKYLYTNLFNRPEHRFYSTRGYSVTLR